MAFHDSEIIEHREEALAAAFYSRWLSLGGGIPGLSQCVGYKRPLFLGGEDSVANLEVSDLDVYWTVAAALIRKARGLAPGGNLGMITFSD